MPAKLWIDIETYSPIDLKRVSPYRYVETPDFLILMAAWSTDGETVHVAVGEDAVRAIPGLRDPDVLKVAHNAAFERVCFSRFFGLPVGQYLPPREWHDTQAVAAELGYPLGLEKLAVALGAEPKDAAGTRLINLFCKPDPKTGKRRLPVDHPDEWLEFVEYCWQDVATLIDVDRRLGGWPTRNEWRVFMADQHINDRGIQVDTRLARRAMAAASENHTEHMDEVRQRTGLANPNSQPQMMRWCHDAGLPNSDLQKETVERLLELPDLSRNTRRVLELRQELALVASKKYGSALESVNSDRRLRGTLRFCGAHTGRWSGRGTQVQNLPRAQLEDEATTDAAIVDLMLGLGADPHTLKALVRAMFKGPFTVVDYSSIEARVLAWLAGEEWALDAFRAGRDIYVETANRMSTPGHQLDRSQGKVAVLALGYNGAVGSLRAMGAQGSDEHLGGLVKQWRRANRNIVNLWGEMQDRFRTGGPVGAHITIETDGKDRLMRLPSGRAVCYRRCSFGERYMFDGRRGRTDTYGGRLIENATQAVARDIMAEALVRLVKAGYHPVGHVHDEIVTEDDQLAEVIRLMVQQPTWAPDLPVDADGFVCNRYRKDWS